MQRYELNEKKIKTLKDVREVFAGMNLVLHLNDKHAENPPEHVKRLLPYMTRIVVQDEPIKVTGKANS